MKLHPDTANKTLFVPGLLLFAALALGCTVKNPKNAGAPGPSKSFCDELGCFQCDADDCWVIPNRACTSDEVCDNGKQCTTIGCASTCSQNNDCTQGEVCLNGFCAPVGFSKVDPYQPPSFCTDDAQCEPDELCEEGACKPRCSSDDECGPGMVCAACGKCQPEDVPATCGSTQVYCSSEVSCGSGKACQSGRCHFQCASSDSCPVGQICMAGLCEDDPAPANPECSIDLDCADGSCINGYCHPACDSSAECGTGHLCQTGVCQPDFRPVS